MKASKNTIKKKITALLVAMAMVFSVMPVMADQAMAYTDNALTVSYDQEDMAISSASWGSLSNCKAVYTLLNRKGVKTTTDELTGKRVSDIIKLKIEGYSQEAYEDYGITFIASDYEKEFTIGSLFEERKAYVGDDTTGSPVEPIIVDENDGLRLYIGQKDISDQNYGMSVNGITQIKITSPQNNEEPPANVLPGDTSWYDESQQSFNIANEEELIGFASLVNNGNSFKGKTVALSNSIKLTKEWTPIGSAQIDSDTNDLTNAKPFEGIFDGKGYTVEGLSIENAEGFNGLFGFNMGTIKNFTVKGSIAGASECDYIGGIVGFNGGIIENVKSDVLIDAGAAANVGGIAGINTSGLWAVSLNKSNKENNLDNAIGSIKNCENLNAVTANQKVGGICGYNAGLVETSSNTGKVTANRGRKSCGGGVVGMNGNNNTAYSSGIVKNCYNTANVDAKNGAWVGGVVGFNSGKYNNAEATPSRVENCYFVGEIVEPYNTDPAAIVGYNEATPESIVNSYNKAELDNEADKGASKLGEAYIASIHGGNGGYPIFTFQEKHIFDKYKTVKKASFGVAGSKIAYCDCGEENQEMAKEIPAVKTPVLSTTSYSFNNKVKTPSVTVKDAAGTIVAKKVSYGDGRKVVGRYAVKVSLSGDDYTGYKTVYFKINPSASKISSLSKGRKSITVKWAKPSSTYRKQMTGYQIRYSTSSKMTSAKTITIKSTTAKYKKIKGLKAKKKYYVQIRKYKKSGGSTYYSTWSECKSTTTR